MLKKKNTSKLLQPAEDRNEGVVMPVSTPRMRVFPGKWLGWLIGNKLRPFHLGIILISPLGGSHQGEWWEKPQPALCSQLLSMRSAVT